MGAGPSAGGGGENEMFFLCYGWQLQAINLQLHEEIQIGYL
jgi:hypothetical protein